MDVIGQLPNDHTVGFYYLGHGYNEPRYDFPSFKLHKNWGKSDGGTVSHFVISRKLKRFHCSLVIFECCNKGSGKGEVGPIDWSKFNADNALGIKQSVLDIILMKRGQIRICSSQKGTLSIRKAFTGAFMTKMDRKVSSKDFSLSKYFFGWKYFTLRGSRKPIVKVDMKD